MTSSVISRPHTVTQWLGWCFLMLGLPLLVAITHGAWQLSVSQRAQAELLTASEHWQRNVEQVADLTESLGRTGSQYPVFQEQTLLTLYRGKELKLLRRLEELRQSFDDAQASRQIGNFADEIRLAGGILTDKTSSEPMRTQVLETFPDLIAEAEQLVMLVASVSRQRLVVIQKRNHRTVLLLMLELAAVLPFLVAVLVILRVKLWRPLQQLDQAVATIAHSNFDDPVHISGSDELVALGKQLDWLRMRLRDQDANRNRFLRHMTHELKTPLTNMRGGSELLREGTLGELNDTQEQVATVLLRNSMDLQHMIENMLDYSAWHERQAKLQFSDFDPRDVLNDILEQHELSVLTKELKVITDYQNALIRADFEKIRLALENLLSNALKYSPHGEQVHIKISTADSEVIIDIADHGPGIPADERERIFEPFYQGRMPQFGHVAGTGIGLSVVRECVDAHHGSITLMGGIYPGAHFRICLPAAPAG